MSRRPEPTTTRGIACATCGADAWRLNPSDARWRCQICSRAKARRRYALVGSPVRTARQRAYENTEGQSYPPLRVPDRADPLARMLALEHGHGIHDDAETVREGREVAVWRQPRGSALIHRHAITLRGFSIREVAPR